jgi:hypothetical protein
VGEECPEFGCFGSVLLCSEHLTRPFCGKGEHNWFSSLPAPWLALIGRCWTHSLGASVQLRLSKIAHFSWLCVPKKQTLQYWCNSITRSAPVRQLYEVSDGDNQGKEESQT